MRLLERKPRLSGLVAGLAMLALATGVHAQPEISTTDPGSIVIFPKVIADGTRDTIISLTNTSNMMAFAHCEATNGIGLCRNLTGDPAQTYYCSSDEDCLNVTDPAGGTIANAGPCDLQWAPGDFDVVLTAQQPTFWRVSTGRDQDPTFSSGDQCTTSGGSTTCPGFFLAPVNNSGAGGSVQAFTEFRGEIRCFQVDNNSMNGSPEGALMPGNALKGEAFIESVDPVSGVGNGLLSAYNAINVQGTQSSDPFTATLDGVQYARCPDELTFDHLAPGSQDPFSGADVDVELTFIPCTFNTVNPTFFALFLETIDMQEQPLSDSSERACWANLTGSSTGSMASRATDFLRTAARASHSGNCTGGTLFNVPCTSDSDCGAGGFCNNNVCAGAVDAQGRICADTADCGGAPGTALCGPPTALLGVIETFYDGGGASPGSSANVMHHLLESTDNVDTMSYTAF